VHITLVGISHKNAPVAVREHYAFALHELPDLLARLGKSHAGAAVLSTCNRTEVYLADPHPLGDARSIVGLLSEVKGEPPIEGAPFFTLTGKEAARHLFRVAAGIESMVVGESEILGQVRGAFTAATAAGTHTPALSRLFHNAIRAGRKVRTQTSIGRYTVSVSSTAVALAKQTLGDLSGKTVLVVGAGEAGKLTAGNIAGSGIGRMLVTSRSAERTADLAEALGGEPIAFDRRADAIAQADIVISSTSAHAFVIDHRMIEGLMPTRGARPLLLVDIAVPRDIDPSVRGIAGVHLYDIDQLQNVAEKNLHLRRQEIVAAEKIVEEEATKYAEWLRSLEVVPTIAALRTRAETVRTAEVERALSRMALSGADRKRVEAMTSALVKKILHDPVQTLKTPGEGDRYVAAARALFRLDGTPGAPLPNAGDETADE
jgi:glutamyl-tRNA reductase